MEYTILLVDDDTNVLEGLRRVLHDNGFRIRCAAGADEALRLLRTDQIHLIISDQVMAGISGTEFLKQVKRLFPNVVRVLLTGHATAEMIVDAVNKGGVERVYLKPCNTHELANDIKDLLQRHAHIAEALRFLEQRNKSVDDPTLERSSKSPDAVRSNTAGEVVLEDPPFGWNTLIRKLDKLSDWNT